MLFRSGNRNVADVISILGQRIITVHLHDNNGDRDAHILPGLGNINWPETIAALRRAGYAGPLICEGGNEMTPVDESVQQFRRWAQSLPLI